MFYFVATLLIYNIKGRQKAVRRDEPKGDEKLLKLDSIVDIPSEDDTFKGD